jgi:peptidoglycan/LPS O-acetylase OafA/YrhL
MSTPAPRLHYLDSVRGLAALSVVCYHFIGWHWSEETAYHLASIVFNGSDAVSFFFVLSGFVLSYPYFHLDRQLDLRRYTFKRVLRLYPAFMFTVLLNYLYWFRYELDMEVVWDILWRNHHQLWQELVMLRNQHMYYIPGWTLGVEMALSLLMPVLIAAARFRIQLVVWLIPFTLLMGPGYLSMFTMHFCLGILLSYAYPRIQAYDLRQARWYRYRWLLYLAVLGLFSIRHLERMFPFGPTYTQFANFWGINLFHYTGLASALILMGIINQPRIQDWLHQRVFLFLGKISYSIYLMHWLVVVFIMERWERWVAVFGGEPMAFVIMFVVAIAVTLLLATLVYFLIERPFIRWAKQWSARLFPAAPNPPSPSART